MTLLLATLLAVTPPVPPVVSVIRSPGRVESIVSFRPGQAKCGDAIPKVVANVDPHPIGISWSSQLARSDVRLKFRIGQDGRPLGIEEQAAPASPVRYPDVAASFALWRFQPGASDDCEILFTASATPVADASDALLYRYLAASQAHSPGRNVLVGRAAFARIKPPGDCHDDPRPGPRVQVYPRFDDIPQPAGTVSLTYLAYDVDAAGNTRNVRTLWSSGNARLDDRAREAIAQSRFQPGARTGCTFSYFRRGNDPVEAPPLPEQAAYRRADADCDGGEAGWAHMPELDFPDAWQRRFVEGWAVIGYDLAPWGQTGNLKVLAAEPAAEFGVQASRIVSQARKPSGSGGTGCVIRVAFKLPAESPNNPNAQATGDLDD